MAGPCGGRRRAGQLPYICDEIRECYIEIVIVGIVFAREGHVLSKPPKDEVCLEITDDQPKVWVLR